eukprot:jgi/Picsp_1/116/NSC_00116-R1_srrm2 protein
MYNGIGLTTVRGSGTSGYVQTNKFNIRGPPSRSERGYGERDGNGEKSDVHRKPNKDILEHNRKREVEVKVMELRVQLEDEEVDEDEIEERLAAYRSELVEQFASNGGLHGKDATMGQNETHEIAARKEREMEKVRHALGFKEDIVEGEAFDRELQEQKKQARIEERKRKERERIEREEERRREMKKKARELEKERLKRIEDMEKAHKAGYYEKYERPPERYDGDVGAVDPSPPASPRKRCSDSENSSSPERRKRRQSSPGGRSKSKRSRRSSSSRSRSRD